MGRGEGRRKEERVGIKAEGVVSRGEESPHSHPQHKVTQLTYVMLALSEVATRTQCCA